MKQKVKIYPLLSVFSLVSMALALLFLTLRTLITPPHAAAQTLTDPHPGQVDREMLITLAPPFQPFLQASNVVTIYLPIIHKNTLVYTDDFSNGDSGWPKGTDSSCESLYESGRYRLNVNNDKECFRFAPTAAERTYGEFEVLAYQSGEFMNNSALGLYTNGQGGNNFYLFIIRPNNSCSSGGSWEFIRNKDGTPTLLRSGTCNLNIKRGYGAGAANILKVRHASDRRITLYINGVQVDTFTEAANDERTGKGTGVYGRAVSNEDAVMKYDDFRVYLP